MFMYNTVVYHGNERLGEVEVYPPESLLSQHQQQYEEPEMERKRKIIDEVVMKDIKISHFSQPSERCRPLAVLHTITPGVCFKMESKSSVVQDAPLNLLHASCVRENKTAVMLLGTEELHFVGMYSRNNEKQHPCFWVFSVSSGLYNSCLLMLNLRCLGIVFDLDETLVVANTMRSFEDRIEALQRRISAEVDPQRAAAMVAEAKRYQDDKSILRQYVENDQVFENGKVIKVQSEVVPSLSDNHQPLVRPLIRLQEKNIILTRINPTIRDTSVLVRLRPAWEELRSYLTAKGRKRFEVYVCTMAERDYALEMWRLLDPDSNLINTRELLDRIVCVKSGLKKSLFNVFHDGICHPKMALVIDDRLKVWDEKDQPRVHVVPAFAPYYAPQAEANALPVLCVARNVACSVRGAFFRDFDEGLLPKIYEVCYEDDIGTIPSAPDVSNYLVSEDDTTPSNGNRDPLSYDGMADAEVERRLKEAVSVPSTVASQVANLDPRVAISHPLTLASSSGSIPLQTAQSSAVPFSSSQFPQSKTVLRPLTHVVPPEPSLQGSPAREEGEVPESELDPDTRRRLLILQHGQDTRDNSPTEPPFQPRPPVQIPAPRVQPRGWFAAEEEMNRGQLSRAVPKEYPLDSEPVHVEKHRPHNSFKLESSVPPDRILHENQRLAKEPHRRDDRLRSNNITSSYPPFYGEEMPLGRSSRSRDSDLCGRTASSAETPAGVLQEIAMKCGAKVEYWPALVATTELQFSIEAWFSGEKIGEGIGRTRREALHHAAESSIKNLANIYMSRSNADGGLPYGDLSNVPNVNGFLGNANLFENQQPLGEDFFIPEESRPVDPRMESSKKSMGSISALKELCMLEGLDVVFQQQHSVQTDEVHAQVEIDGQVLGKGIGSTWDEARTEAAERALGSLRPMLGQFSQKRQGSPRSVHGMSSKRLKPELGRPLQRLQSGRYTRNAPAVP